VIEKTFFRRWTLAATLTLGCLLGVSASAQEPTDDPNDELTIEGDSAVFLQAQNSIEYSGNVVAFMNGLRINGDRVLVQMSNDRVERVTTSGQPASFWQEHSGRSQDTTARAETIVYLPSSGLLELSGSASLIQGSNEVRSALIRYNLIERQLDARGDKETSERVRMQLSVPANATDARP
jgi:lipopolysaccharide transport protein LptA